MMMPGDVIYWTDGTPEGPDQARAFCKSRGLTSEDVRLVKRAKGDMKMIMVEVRRPCKLKVG